MPKNGSSWQTITTISLASAIGKEPVAAHESQHELGYTVLNDRDVCFRNAQELAELHSVNPSIPPTSYVAFRPSRLALHETIVAVVTTLQTSNEKDMQALTQATYEQILKAVEKIPFDETRTQIQSEVSAYVSRYLDGKRDIDPFVLAICDEVTNSKTIFGKYKEGYTQRDAMIALATDKLFTETINPILESVVDTTIKELVSSNPIKYKYLEIPPPEKRITLMAVGGIASGKGSSIAMLQENAKKENIEWKNVARINGDSIKSILLEPGTVKPMLYSQLAQEETAIITKTKIKPRLNKMATNRHAPHILLDQTRLEADIPLGLLNNGKIRGILVSTDVEDSIERSFHRGSKEGALGRYEATSGILRTHKMATTEFVPELKKHIGQDIEFLIVDNNVPENQLATEVALIDLAKRNITLYSPEKLERLAIKQTINPNATCHEELYQDTNTSKTYLDPLTNGDPKCTLLSTTAAKDEDESTNTTTRGLSL